MTRTFTLRYPDELRSALRRVVRSKGGTMNGLILQILWGWLKEHEQEKAQ